MPFAKPASQLYGTSDSKIQSASVTRDPAGGQGYSLNDKGEVPIASSSGRWTMEFVEVTRDFGSVNAHTGGNYQETIPGLMIEDLCFFVGTDGGATTTFGPWVVKTRTVCTVADEITVDYYNAHTSALDPASQLLCFLVIHRFINT